MKVEYTLNVKSEIEITDIYSSVNEEARGRFDQMGLQPAYTRYEGMGEFVITNVNQSIKRSSNLI